MKRDSDTQRQIVGKVWKLKIKAPKDQRCAMTKNVKIDFLFHHFWFIYYVPWYLKIASIHEMNFFIFFGCSKIRHRVQIASVGYSNLRDSKFYTFLCKWSSRAWKSQTALSFGKFHPTSLAHSQKDVHLMNSMFGKWWLALKEWTMWLKWLRILHKELLHSQKQTIYI